MASTIIVPVRAEVGFLDLIPQFEVCATVLLDLPIIGGVRSPKVCANATTLSGILTKLINIWMGGIDPTTDYHLAFEVGDPAELIALLTELATHPFTPITSPTPPTINAGMDDDVIVYVGTYGVTGP